MDTVAVPALLHKSPEHPHVVTSAAVPSKTVLQPGATLAHDRATKVRVKNNCLYCA